MRAGADRQYDLPEVLAIDLRQYHSDEEPPLSVRDFRLDIWLIVVFGRLSFAVVATAYDT